MKEGGAWEWRMRIIQISRFYYVNFGYNGELENEHGYFIDSGL